MVTPFAVSTPIFFAVILLMSSSEFSHEARKPHIIIKAAGNKKVWNFKAFIGTILHEGKNFGIAATRLLLIFLPDKPDITERKTKADFIHIFSKIIVVISPVKIFKSEIHDAVLVVVKAMF